ERLLLDRVALHAADVTPGHEQAAGLVVAHLAHANRAFGQRTAVAAREASQAAVAEPLVQVTLPRLVREHLSQCRHRRLHCTIEPAPIVCGLGAPTPSERSRDRSRAVVPDIRSAVSHRTWILHQVPQASADRAARVVPGPRPGAQGPQPNVYNHRI